MKREIRLYNLILPVWLLFILPQVWLVILPGNLAVDCLVLFLALLLLKRPDKRALMKPLWWRFWWRGFAADFLGVLWLLLGWLLVSFVKADSWLFRSMEFIMHNPFGHPLAFLWTLIAVAIAGYFVYRFDLRCMGQCSPALSPAERRRIALSMAIFTAPWTFFIPVY